MMLILSADHCFLLTTVTTLGGCRGWLTHTCTITHTCRLLQVRVHTHLHVQKHNTHLNLNLATPSHTFMHTHKQTNCLDGIWLCNLKSDVWGSLLLNPLNALGIPASSSFSLSLLYLPTSVLLSGWMNTYHLADKESSTLALALSLGPMFALCEGAALHRCFMDHVHLIQQRSEKGVEA